MIKPLDI